MNKKIQVVLSTIIVIILFGIQVAYALSTNQDVGFFEVSANEIASGETLEMTFNLDKIEYDNFKILLNSNIDTGEIYTDENITIEEDSDAIVIDVDKTKLNLSEIKLCYAVTEDMDINTIIQLKAQIQVEEEVETQDNDGNTVTQKQEKVVLEGSQNVTIAQRTEEENTENDNTQKDSTQKDNDNIQKDTTQKDKDSNNSKEIDSTKTSEEQKENGQNEKNTGTALKPSNLNENMSQKSSQNLSNTNAKSGNTNMSSSGASGMQSSSQSGEKTETATYNGSNNNYLEKLKVKGLELNTTFNKENTTYFVNVTDTSSLKITATAEDDTAKVVVTGNDSISEGTNKILIAVTAENGDVRYYRIFANCKLS